MNNLYGVLLRNVFSNNEEIEMVACFDSLKKAQKYEREIRFLDNVVSREEYRKSVHKIKRMAQQVLVVSEMEEENIEFINQYPLLVQFFEE